MGKMILSIEHLQVIVVYFLVVGILILAERMTLSERMKQYETERRVVGILTVLLPSLLLVVKNVSALTLWLAILLAFGGSFGILIFVDALRPVEVKRIARAQGQIAATVESISLILKEEEEGRE
jgi:hypothetical protein